MNESNKNGAQLFDRVRSLNLPHGKFVIFGSGPMAIRGLKEPHDIDIVVTQELYDEYKQKEGWTEKEAQVDRYLEQDCIELWYNWRPAGWDVASLIDRAETIDGLSFVPLQDVLTWKRQMNREKDQDDVRCIETYLDA